MKLEFLGAMGSVGASGISIEDGSDRIVLDYGTKVREVPPKFPLPVERPKAILLSHAHLDHCLHPDTYVQLSNGEILKIEEIYEKGESSFMSIDSNLKVTRSESSKKVRLKAPRELYKIKTQIGWIKVTPEHRFFVLEGLELVEKRAFELKEGDFIAAVKSIPFDGSPINLENIIKNVDSKPIKIKFPKETTPELCQFLGYVIGDGDKGEKRIRITDKDVKNLQFYQNLAKKIFGINGYIYFDGRNRLVFSSKPLLQFLLQFDGLLEKSPERRIPRIIHKLSNKEVAAFLRGLFDAEGSVGHHHVILRTTSENILQVAQFLLARFGIISVRYDESKYMKKTFGNRSYGLYIYDPHSLRKFKEHVGFSSQAKREKLENLLRKIREPKMPKIDLIPLSSDILLKIKKDLRISSVDFRKGNVRESHYLKGRHKLSRRKLKDLINVIENRLNEIRRFDGNIRMQRKILRLFQREVASGIGRSQTWVGMVEREMIKDKEGRILRYLKSIKEEMLKKGEFYLKKLKTLLDSDILWVKILKIEKVKADCEYVYDLTIPKYSNYIANNLIVHNSGGIPLLVKKYSTPIYALDVTKELTELLLEDSIKVSREEGIELPYNEFDLKQTMKNFVLVSYHKPFRIGNFKITYFDAGHIPGSAMIFVENKETNVLYTGDFNDINTRLLEKCEEDLPRVKNLIIESTYSDREHPDRKREEKEFVKMVEETISNNSPAIVAVFAVGRAQEILLILAKHGISYPVFMDGMAKRATTIINKYKKYLRGPDELDDALKFVTYVEGRMRRKLIKEAACIITTSGMLNGGPVVKYLEKLHKNERASLILTGWQIEGTPGKILLETGRFIYENLNIEVKMRVKRFDFSAHAGRKSLFEFVKKLNPEKVFCIHGDHTEEFAEELRREGFAAIAPLANNRIFEL